jgi:hypothetical protein
MTITHSTHVAASTDVDATQISLVDLLDRLLGTGVVISGDVVVSLAGVDLVQIRLNALVTSVRAQMALEPGNRRRRSDA